MDFKTFSFGLLPAFLSMFVSICFGQADNINEYRKIESIDNRLEELKRSLQNMQREAGYKETEKELIKSARPSANSSQRIINTNKINLPAIEKPPPAPPVERITKKERESFDSTKKSADALIKGSWISHTHSVVDEFRTLFTLVSTAAAMAAANAPESHRGNTSPTIVPNAASPMSPYSL